MAVIDTVTFRLSPTLDPDEFRALDARFQTEVVYPQPGLIRRTTARSDDGRWRIVTSWRSDTAADEAQAQFARHPLTEAMTGAVDPSTATADRFATLD